MLPVGRKNKSPASEQHAHTANKQASSIKLPFLDLFPLAHVVDRQLPSFLTFVFCENYETAAAAKVDCLFVFSPHRVY